MGAIRESVLVVGCGGLGSPVLSALLRAGVQKVGMVDGDVVESSNLQRQTLHGEESIGRNKALSAKEALGRVFPEAELEAVPSHLEPSTAVEWIGRYDLVVDATDHFHVRYLMNDVCLHLGKPWVHGSVYRFEGQAMAFGKGGRPCYRCLYPEPPGQSPSCAEGGILGAVAGVVGSLQAQLALEILRSGKVEATMFRYDAVKSVVRKIALQCDPQCRCAGEARPVAFFPDDPFYTHRAGCEGEGVDDEWIDAGKLRELIRGERPPQVRILDVREPHELEAFSLSEALHIPVGELQERLHELNPEQRTIVLCQGEGRTRRALRLLKSLGFRSVAGLRGGLDAWIGLPDSDDE